MRQLVLLNIRCMAYHEATFLTKLKQKPRQSFFSVARCTVTVVAHSPRGLLLRRKKGKILQIYPTDRVEKTSRSISSSWRFTNPRGAKPFQKRFKCFAESIRQGKQCCRCLMISAKEVLYFCRSAEDRVTECLDTIPNQAESQACVHVQHAWY